jgi:DNA repair protein RecO (recombination protein O)
MPLRETEALVLRTYRLGEADKIVSLFTRQLGRLRAVAAGAQRPKSRYGGTLEAPSYIRLWVFERENRDLLRINSVELLESFFEMQKDYRTHVAAQFVAEVVERFLPERDVNERAFRLSLMVLRALKRSREQDRPLLYFDYWLLRLSGFLPDVDRCQACGRVLGGALGYYGTGSEGLLCPECRPSAVFRGLSPTARALAGTVRQVALDRWVETQTVAPQAVREARLFFEEVIASHAEKKLVTRELLEDDV